MGEHTFQVNHDRAVQIAKRPAKRGRAMLPELPLLAPSDGKKSEVGASWPMRGLETAKGRLWVSSAMNYISKC